MDLEDKIGEIFIETIKMFDLSIKYLNNSFSYFFKDEKEEEKEKEINDNLIDEDLINIEKQSLNIILRERPFASDLRRVTGIFKLVDDIERLGDHSEDIAWCVANLKKEAKYHLYSKALLEMINLSLNMVYDSYQSLVKEDTSLAVNVLKNDDLVDALYLKVLEELKPNNLSINDSSYIIYSTLIAKYVERIADHASNIAEWVIYIKSGYYKDEVII